MLALTRHHQIMCSSLIMLMASSQERDPARGLHEVLAAGMDRRTALVNADAPACAHPDDDVAMVSDAALFFARRGPRCARHGRAVVGAITSTSSPHRVPVVYSLPTMWCMADAGRRRSGACHGVVRRRWRRGRPDARRRRVRAWRPRAAGRSAGGAQRRPGPRVLTLADALALAARRTTTSRRHRYKQWSGKYLEERAPRSPEHPGGHAAAQLRRQPEQALQNFALRRRRRRRRHRRDLRGHRSPIGRRHVRQSCHGDRSAPPSAPPSSVRLQRRQLRAPQAVTRT